MVTIDSWNVKGILFDIDGTFYPQSKLTEIYTSTQIALATKLVEIQMGSRLTDQIGPMRKRYVDKANELGSFVHAFVHLGGSADQYKAIADFVDTSRFLTRDPELRETIKKLKEKLKTGVLTGSSTAQTRVTCDSLFGSNWENLFDVVTCSGWRCSLCRY